MDTLAIGTGMELPGDEELAALALAADPDAPLSENATPFLADAVPACSTLPTWYMPPAIVAAGSRGRRLLVGLLVLTLLAIEISGLCTVFGQLVVG